MRIESQTLSMAHSPLWFTTNWPISSLLHVCVICVYIIIIIDLVLLSMHYNSIHYVVIIGTLINDSVPSSVRESDS